MLPNHARGPKGPAGDGPSVRLRTESYRPSDRQVKQHPNTVRIHTPADTWPDWTDWSTAGLGPGPAFPKPWGGRP